MDESGLVGGRKQSPRKAAVTSVQKNLEGLAALCDLIETHFLTIQVTGIKTADCLMLLQESTTKGRCRAIEGNRSRGRNKYLASLRS